MSFGEYFNAFGSLGDTVRDGLARQEQKAALAKLGDQLAVNDYTGAAKTAFAAGDAATGLKLFTAGQSAAQSKASGAELAQIMAGLYPGGGSTGADSGAPRANLPTFAQGSDVGNYANAIAGIESGGRYDIVGPNHPKYGQALGRYQVMESNLPAWSRETLGREVSKQEFLSSPQIQDAIFQKKFGQSVEKYGNPQDAASVWFTGRPLAQGAGSRDSLGTTGQKYVNMFTANLARSGGAPVGQAPTLPVTAMGMPGTGADPTATAMQMPGLINNPPAPPQRPVQIASADPNSLSLPAPTRPAPAPAAPVRPMQVPQPAQAASPAWVDPPPRATPLPPAMPGGPSMVGAAPPSMAPAAAPTASAPVQPAPADDSEDAPDAPAQQAVPPQVRAQVSANAGVHLEQAGVPAPMATGIAAAPPASQARIQALLRASMLPGLSEPASKVVSTLLTNELEQTKLPDTAKQYIFAKSAAGGGYDGTYADFVNKSKDEGAKIQAQFEARKRIAQEQGMDLKDPGVQAYLLGNGRGQNNHVLHQMDELRDPTGRLLAKNDGGGTGGMSDEQAGYTADRVIAGDTKAMIGLDKAARARVTGLVAQRAMERGIDPSDILHNAAVASGLGAQERSLGSQAGRMSAAAQEAENAIGFALQASDKVARTQFVPLNRVIQMVQSNTGDPAIREFNAANNALVNTYSRAISPTGVATDSARQHAYDLLQTANTKEQYAQVVDLLHREIQAAHKSPQQARDSLEAERQAVKRGGVGVNAGTITTTVPNPVAPDRAPTAAPPQVTRTPAAQFREGQTATGPNGQKVIFSRGQWVPLNPAPATTASPQAGGVL